MSDSDSESEDRLEKSSVQRTDIRLIVKMPLTVEELGNKLSDLTTSFIRHEDALESMTRRREDRDTRDNDTVRVTGLKPHMFTASGRESWRDFRDSFEIMNSFNGWTDLRMRQCLRHSMRGKAASMVADIHPSQCADLKTMLDRYEARFMPPSFSSVMRAQVAFCRQGPQEDILGYHTRLRAIYDRAYNEAPDTSIHLIETFINGLRSPAVMEHVRRANPQTYAQALDTALNETAIVDRASCAKSNDFTLFNPNLDATLPSQEQFIAAIKGNVRCYFCQKLGHMKKDCKVWATAKTRFSQVRRGNSWSRNSAVRDRSVPVQKQAQASWLKNRRQKVRKLIMAAIGSEIDPENPVEFPSNEDEEVDLGPDEHNLLEGEEGEDDFSLDEFLAALDDDELDAMCLEGNADCQDLALRP